MGTRQRTRLSAAAATAVLAVMAAGCAAEGQEGADRSSGTAAAGVALPEEVSHVHAVDVDPEGGDILVATHEGLYVLPAPGAGDGAAEARRVGPAIDLMGFAVAGPGRYVASGHPHPGVDMPDPVGLIESRDGGSTWQALSRAGRSDFHALAATPDRVVGFDGALRATEDGTTWEALDEGVEPFSLGVADGGRTVVATTRGGLVRSTDGGSGFSAVDGAPLLALVDWVPGTDAVLGVAPDGGVHRSEDAGASWEPAGRIDGGAQALHADADQVVAVTGDRVVRSTDGGSVFGSW
ncbi:F510_1955 family glycosylhydrolase [Nocardiopsis tropica]|uniref:F510_1955 family glycosylhydrolase n=1 Tax=Nocardiopsis tropica TaxID=109330 RepID=UPI0031D86080